MSKRELWYRALRERDPSAYRKAIEYMEVVTLNHKVDLTVAADYEVAAVMLLCEVLNIEIDT